MGSSIFVLFVVTCTLKHLNWKKVLGAKVLTFDVSKRQICRNSIALGRLASRSIAVFVHISDTFRKHV